MQLIVNTTLYKPIVNEVALIKESLKIKNSNPNVRKYNTANPFLLAKQSLRQYVLSKTTQRYVINIVNKKTPKYPKLIYPSAK